MQVHKSRHERLASTLLVCILSVLSGYCGQGYLQTPVALHEKCYLSSNKLTKLAKKIYFCYQDYFQLFFFRCHQPISFIMKSFSCSSRVIIHMADLKWYISRGATKVNCNANKSAFQTSWRQHSEYNVYSCCVMNCLLKYFKT